MIQVIVLTFPMAVAWMILAGQPSIEGFIVGFVFGFAILYVVRLNTATNEDDKPINLAKIPVQIITLFVYSIKLAWDVCRSGVDVARIVIMPTMPIKPGVQRISTQDETKSGAVAALSAHSITITPGELVIDFEEDGDQVYMLVHSLDKEASDEEKLIADQTNRLKLIERILGRG